MKIIPICPDSFAANTYLLVSKDKAIVVDPSVSVGAVERVLKQENTELCGIILTHGHFDHTISVDTLRSNFAVPLMVHEADAPMLTNGKINGFYDFYGRECTHKAAESMLVDQQEIDLGDETVKVISTPGHSPGSICLLCKNEDAKDFLVTGDTLFAGSIGRCDLWQGDDGKMRSSISLLSKFDGDIMIYPGHGSCAPLSVALSAARFYIDF